MEGVDLVQSCVLPKTISFKCETSAIIFPISTDLMRKGLDSSLDI